MRRDGRGNSVGNPINESPPAPPHQIAHRFVRGIGNPDRGQLAGTMSIQDREQSRPRVRALASILTQRFGLGYSPSWDGPLSSPRTLPRYPPENEVRSGVTGGGGSLERTRLCSRFPTGKNAGNCRDFRSRRLSMGSEE